MTEGPSQIPSPASLVAEEQGTFELRDYWRILVRRRNAVFLTLGLVVAVALLASFLATPIYRASAVIQISREGPDILTFQDVLNVDSSRYQDFYQTQYRILQSRAVLRIAAERIDLVHRPEFAARKRSPIARMLAWVKSPGARPDGGGDSDPALGRAIGFIEDNLAVQQVRSSHLVRVSFADRDPVLARDVANAVIAAYQQFNLDERYSTTAQASEFLTKQVAQLQAEITDKERQLQTYGVQKEILAVSGEARDITSQALAATNATYVEAKSRLALATARMDSLNAAPADALPEVVNSPLLSRLRQEHAEIERDRGKMAARFGPNWPALRQLDDELKRAKEMLDAEAETLASQVRQIARADHQRAEAEVALLERQVEAQQDEVQRFAQDAIEFASLQAEIASKRAFLDELVGRQSQTAVSDNLRDTRASNVRVVDPAETPSSPFKPRKLLNLLTSLVVGLGLGVVAALLLDHMDYTVKNEQDILNLARLPVLGHVCFFRPLRVVGAGQVEIDAVGMGSHIDPRSAFAETFKNLRTSILLASPERPPRHIVVTSCEPGDGKSTVSANLAIVLTQMGRRVLLVDADLRRPRVHKMFQLPNDVGLSSYLTGNAGLDELIQDSEVPNLRIISSGPIPPTPSELLGSPSLGTLLDRLSAEDRFDHIILDSTPSLQVADSIILAARADATIVVVHAGKTARETLAQGVSRLRQAHTHVVGAVLNAVTAHAGYYYGAYRVYQEAQGDDKTTPRSASRLGRPRRRSGSG